MRQEVPTTPECNLRHRLRSEVDGGRKKKRPEKKIGTATPQQCCSGTRNLRLRDVTRMIETEMRGLGLFGGALLSTGTLAQVQQPRSACMENAIAVRCTAGSHAERATSAEQNRRSTICRDDLRPISFLPSSGLKQKVTVPPDGIVAPPDSGSVYVHGSTLPRLVDGVKKAYSKTFQKAFFAVPGQVEMPGQYDLGYDLTVTQAIAPAGGLAARAKCQVFPYRSASSNWAEVQELKIKDLFHGKNISDGRHARHGDMILAPEKRAQAPRGERLLRWCQRA